MEKKKISLFEAKKIFIKEILWEIDLKNDSVLARLEWIDFMKQMDCDYIFPESLLIEVNRMEENLTSKKVKR
jgi:uncharacterized FlgJ-related protein